MEEQYVPGRDRDAARARESSRGNGAGCGPGGGSRLRGRGSLAQGRWRLQRARGQHHSRLARASGGNRHRRGATRRRLCFAGRRVNLSAPDGQAPSSQTADVAAWVQLACLTEATVAKPGNVSPSAGFVDVGYEDFVLSALAIGPAFMLSGSHPLGEVVLSAVRDNTNLGLVLLLAPLAMAAMRGGRSLRKALSEVLNDLTLDDARMVYEAIRTARAGGLGAV